MYVTKQGECWDEVAKNVYGNEKYVGYLMQNNMESLEIAVFSAGALICTPELPEEQRNLPEWRRRS